MNLRRPIEDNGLTNLTIRFIFCYISSWVRCMVMAISYKPQTLLISQGMLGALVTCMILIMTSSLNGDNMIFAKCYLVVHQGLKWICPQRRRHRTKMHTSIQSTRKRSNQQIQGNIQWKSMMDNQSWSSLATGFPKFHFIIWSRKSCMKLNWLPVLKLKLEMYHLITSYAELNMIRMSHIGCR